MKSKFWPQRPRKWPLDLNDLGRGWVIFFKNYIFKIIASILPRSLGQEVIFEVTEAKFWISSSFNKFSFRIFIVLGFKVVWPQWPQRPQKWHTQIFWKQPQINVFVPKIDGEIAKKKNKKQYSAVRKLVTEEWPLTWFDWNDRLDEFTIERGVNL